MMQQYNDRQKNDPCENSANRFLLNYNNQKSLRGYGWALLIIPALIFLGYILFQAISSIPGLYDFFHSLDFLMKRPF